MKIYVGTYNKYNKGSIAGAWLALNDYNDAEQFIDAWRECEGYTWNAWYDVGDITADAIQWNARKLLKYFRDNGFLTENSAGKCAIEDDQYNTVIVERSTRRPLFAIEYGVDN